MRYRNQIWRRMGALLLCAVLCFLMVASLSGCETSTEPPVYDTRLNFLSNTGVSIYRIVYPKTDCSAAVGAVAEELQGVMTQVLGTDVALTDDHDSALADDGLRPYEILIGTTARTETQNLLSELGKDEYVIRVVGHKIVIAGSSNRATVAGVRRFMAQVLGYADGQPTITGADVKIEANFSANGRYEVSPHVNDVTDTVLKGAPLRAVTLFALPMPEDASNMLTATVLQGLITLHSSEQIYLVTEQNQDQLTAMAEDGVVVFEQTDDEQDWTTARLLEYYAAYLKGYILCSSDFASESVGVAISLAHHLGAVVVTAENEETAQAAGLSCVLDVTDKNDAWLRASNYFALMDQNVAVEPAEAFSPALIDYVVMSGCYYYRYRDVDDYMHLQQFKFLNDDAYLLTVDAQMSGRGLSFADIGVRLYLMPEKYLHNLSVLSGYMPRELNSALFGEKTHID